MKFDADVLVEESHKFIVWCPWFSFWWIVGLSLIGCGATYPQQRHSIKLLFQVGTPDICKNCTPSLRNSHLLQRFVTFWRFWRRLARLQMNDVISNRILFYQNLIWWDVSQNQEISSFQWFMGWIWVTHSDLTFSPRNSREIGGFFIFRALAPRLFFTQSHGFVDWLEEDWLDFNVFGWFLGSKLVQEFCSGSFCSTSDIWKVPISLFPPISHPRHDTCSRLDGGRKTMLSTLRQAAVERPKGRKLLGCPVGS